MSKLPINLEDLLRQRTVEGERIEYKAGWNPDAIIRTLCAFANDFENLGGGYVIIGQDCDEAGRPVFPPVGLSEGQLDVIQRDLLTRCNLIQPPYFPVLSVEELEGRMLIVLWAPGGLRRPYKAPRAVTATRKEYRFYIRRYSSTIEAKNDDERELIGLTANVPFDDRFHRAASVSDLDLRLMVDFLHEVGSALAQEAGALSAEALGRQMNVVGGPQELPLPKNVGLLFFNEDPRRFFPVTQIDVVFFPEGPGGDQFEEKVFAGPVGRITRDAISFIERSYLKQTVIKHPDRPEAERLWNFPLAAIEEAIVNAVYHRSYEVREPIEVRITPEELVVLSFPGPDRSIKMDELRAGRAVSRRYRNRRIGEFLKELDLTEGRSTGISKMLKVMAANGSPAPIFETDEDRSYFVVRLPAHERAGRRGTGQVTGHVGTKSGPSRDQAADQVTDHVTEHVGTKSGPSRDQVTILEKCKKEASITELMEVAGRANRTKFRDQVLRPLLDAGLVEMTIPDKPRSSKQKYRLTAAGQAVIAARGRS